MSDLGDADTSAVYYRTKDPIKNFKIRVRLSNGSGSTLVVDTNAKHADDEVCVINWQEKLFSKAEFDKYADEANCKTPLERKYNEDVKKLQQNGSGRTNNRIFTFTDYDAFDQSRDEEPYTTAIGNEVSKLAEAMRMLKSRRGGGAQGKARQSARGVPRTNLVEDEPSIELIKKNHYLTDKSQLFYIMADLTAQQTQQTAEEASDATPLPVTGKQKQKKRSKPAKANFDNITDPVLRAVKEGRYTVLCVIKSDPRGIISVEPNFNGSRKPYSIESDYASGGANEYIIENCSANITIQDREHEQRMHRELYGRHKDFMMARIGHEFEMPHPDVLRVLVFGEIVGARDFEYNHLYVRYLIDLPQNWFVLPTQALSGVSQICDTITEVHGRDDIAYFAFPFEIQLFYKNATLDSEKQEEMPHWPTLIFEVSSVDSWNRQRVEGYSFLHVPPKPGQLENKRLDCWRPLGSSIANELRRFFIGGSPELEDPTYPAIPSSFDGKNLSKFGLRTQTTGSLHIRLHTIHQTHVSVEELGEVDKESALVRNLTQPARRTDILDVLAEYNRSRNRLHQVRQTLQMQLGDLDKIREPTDTVDSTINGGTLQQEAELLNEAISQRQDENADTDGYSTLGLLS